VKYAVVNVPPRDEDIESFRNLYDTQASLISAHVTLVFPFELDESSEQNLKSHVASVAAASQPFQVHFNDSITFEDGNLFLLSDKQDQITMLHDELYTGMLSDFLRSDLPYMPHITVGQTKNDGAESAFAESHLTDKIGYDFNNVEIIKIEEAVKEFQRVGKYQLGEKV